MFWVLYDSKGRLPGKCHNRKSSSVVSIYVALGSYFLIQSSGRKDSVVHPLADLRRLLQSDKLQYNEYKIHNQSLKKADQEEFLSQLELLPVTTMIQVLDELGCCAFQTNQIQLAKPTLFPEVALYQHRHVSAQNLKPALRSKATF
jgi:hypothetical protein